jgi:hypothetical protein
LAGVVGVHAGGRARLMHLYCSLQARHMHDMAAVAAMGGGGLGGALGVGSPAVSGSASVIDGLWAQDSSVTLGGGAPVSPASSHPAAHASSHTPPHASGGPQSVTRVGSLAAASTVPGPPPPMVMDLSG